MRRAPRWAFLALCLLSQPLFAQGKYELKINDEAPPKELAEPVQKLLAGQSMALISPAGKEVAEFWFRKDIPADATVEQVKNGLTYKEVKQTEILGAVRFVEDGRDYRKQKVKAGVYTLRLGFQPADGDHQGSSDFQDFLVVIDAAKDTKAETMEAKHMIELSGKSISTGHPGVFMLFPNSKPGNQPTLDARAKQHWVLNGKGNVTIGGKDAGGTLGIGLTVIGSAE